MVRPGVTTRNPREKFLLFGAAHRVEGLPGDEHGRDGGLARAGGEFQRQAGKLRIRIVAGIGKMLEKALAGFAELRRHLGQPDRRFDRFHLAEEGAHARELMTPPMLQEACGFGSDQPLTRRKLPPLIHVLANFVDDGSWIILLSARGKAVVVGKDDVLLLGPGAAAGPGNRGDELCATAAIGDRLGGLALSVQFPVPRGILVRRVQNRTFKKSISHKCTRVLTFKSDRTACCLRDQAIVNSRNGPLPSGRAGD